MSTAALTIAVRAQTAAHSLSPSQANTFLDCAARWYFAKVLGLPNPQGGALALGHAVHRTVAGLMRGKGANGGELPTLAQGLEVFEVVWPDELTRTKLAADESADTLAKTGRKIIAKYHQQVAPGLIPARVEQEISGEIGGIHVNAIIDLVTKDEIVYDLKTASKKPGKISAEHTLQLITGAMLAEKKTARLITITKTDAPAVVQHTLTIGPEERRYAESIYPQVAAGMQSGLYPPRRSSYLCSRKYCPFWRECIAEFGGDVQ